MLEETFYAKFEETESEFKLEIDQGEELDVNLGDVFVSRIIESDFPTYTGQTTVTPLVNERTVL